MVEEKLLIKARHVVLLTILFIIPASAAYFLLLETEADAFATIVNGLAGTACLGIGIAVLASIGLRRSIKLTDDCLVVRHSFYRIEIRKSHISKVTCEKCDDVTTLYLSSKKNGIAGFGFYSGWFHDRQGELVFCAISSLPTYRFVFAGDVQCRSVVLSCSSDMANKIFQWGSMKKPT